MLKKIGELLGKIDWLLGHVAFLYAIYSFIVAATIANDPGVRWIAIGILSFIAYLMGKLK